MDKTILIGCPVYQRDWILPDWFEAIEKQNYPLDKIGFTFELGPEDEATYDALYEWHGRHPEVIVFDGEIREDIPHHHHPDRQRHWDGEKYLNMVEMRNSLLERATNFNFDMYFSLDSDILLTDPDTLAFLAENIDYYDVISPLMFMTPFDTDYPSVMWWSDYIGGHAIRDNSKVKWGKFFEADIVMAAVAMSPKVYKNIRYRWHKQGEDLGFAGELGRRGIKSYCASNLYGFHAMHQQMLIDFKHNNYTDPRSDYMLLNT